MEVITMESQVFKDLTAKINSIAGFVIEHQRKEEAAPADGWVDSYEVCTFLKISSRTLQRLRAQGAVNYSLIRGKTFYRISEISRLLDEHAIRSSKDNLQDLIANHKLYAEQRRNTKTDK
ncbi:MAG: helix-turn-helix domain-containing protein [Bacteroidales bacterium]|jgi:hypothetical protein|nr:helix-turn-helix domain-containing protein [Bacteroidales bacterium]